MKSLFAARPRIASLIIACIGFVLICVNHRTVQTEHNFYPMLMLFGPVCVLVGIANAIDPRVLNVSGDSIGHAAVISGVVVIVLVGLGLGAGWAMAHFWYHIW